MTRLRAIVWSLGLVLVAGPAAADVVSQAPMAVSATLYRDPFRPAGQGIPRDAPPGGLVLISEERVVDVPAGVSRIAFRNVADTIVPQTATLSGLLGRVVEQNFDYDLLTPATLAAKSTGARVRLISTNPATGAETERAGVLRASADGVVLDFDGRLEALHCSGLPERLVFDRVPATLADRPVLSMVVSAAKAGRRKVRLSYLATGFDWQASYVARIRPDGRSLDLSGWITMTNGSAVTLPDAPVQLIAGQLNRVGDASPQIPSPGTWSNQPQCWPALLQEPVDLVVTGARMPMPAMMAAPPPAPEPAPPPPAPAVTTRDLGDYKLYALPFPTTLAARQTKQVAFLDQRGVAFDKVYQFDVNVWQVEARGYVPAEQPAAVLVRLRNDKAAGLGLALPAGSTDVLEPARAGRPVLVGEDAVEDTPVGLDVNLTLGRAQEVRVEASEQNELAEFAGGVRTFVHRYRVAAFNAKAVPVTLEIRHQANGESGVLVAESQPHGRRDGLPTWTLQLKPGERQLLDYEVSDEVAASPANLPVPPSLPKPPEPIHVSRAQAPRLAP